jgi:hypothetical protein
VIEVLPTLARDGTESAWRENVCIGRNGDKTLSDWQEFDPEGTRTRENYCPARQEQHGASCKGYYFSAAEFMQ